MSDNKTSTDLNQQQLDYIQKAMKQNHELRQVCLEVVRCLNQSNPSPQRLAHCNSELNRVLFVENDFLH